MVYRNSLQDDCSGPEFAIGEMYAIRQFKTTKDRLNGGLKFTAVMHAAEWAPGVNEADCTAAPSAISKHLYDALSLLSAEEIKRIGLRIYKTDKLSSSSSSKTAIGGKLYARSGVLPYSAYNWNNWISIEEDTGYWLSHSKTLVPKPDCTCGFYAYHNVEALMDNAYDAEWVGVIRAHGRIVVGEKGLRAEKAEIVALARKNLHDDLEDYTDTGYKYLSGSYISSATNVVVAYADYLDVQYDSSESTFTFYPKSSHTSADFEEFVRIKTQERLRAAKKKEQEVLAEAYPDAVFFDTVEQMLEQFPLTGPDEFRDSTQNS